MLTTTRYIHLNLVRANMVERPEEQEYSSYRMHIGDKKEKLISSERVLSYFKEERKRELYKVFVEKGIKLQAKEEAVVLVTLSHNIFTSRNV